MGWCVVHLQFSVSSGRPVWINDGDAWAPRSCRVSQGNQQGLNAWGQEKFVLNHRARCKNCVCVYTGPYMGGGHDGGSVPRDAAAALRKFFAETAVADVWPFDGPHCVNLMYHHVDSCKDYALPFHELVRYWWREELTRLDEKNLCYINTVQIFGCIWQGVRIESSIFFSRLASWTLQVFANRKHADKLLSATIYLFTNEWDIILLSVCRKILQLHILQRPI